MAIETFIDVSKAASDVMIDDINLNDEFIRQPGLVFYYVAQLAKAERQVAELKLRLEATEAKVAANVRTEAAEKSEKLTEAGLKERVRLHATVVRTEQELIAAQEIAGTIKAAVEAMRHKKDMLLVRGYTNRDELKARIDVRDDLALNAKSGVVESVKEQLRERQATTQ